MREKRTRGQEKAEPLFDYKLDDVDFGEPLQLNFHGVSADTISSLAAAAEKESHNETQVKQHLTTTNIGYTIPRPISKSDPLNPEHFMGHHRRMEREERRMQVQERQQLIVMASRIRTQKENLSRPDWKSIIEKVVRIVDSSDLVELKRKRELALNEMETFLSKFEEYNKRYNKRENRASSPNSEDTLAKSGNKKKIAVSDKSSKPKPHQKMSSSAPAKPKPVFEEPEDLILSIRPCVFGYMVPPRIFPPQEFALPQLLHTEVESLDLVEELKKNRHSDP